MPTTPFRRGLGIALGAAAIAALVLTAVVKWPTGATSASEPAAAHPVEYRTVEVQGLPVFYREAGDPAKPTLVLLHGVPASSFMFRELIGALADSYHLVAPDYIGFGQSATPPVDRFDYSFAKLAEITLGLLDRLALDRFALYMQDYGAPIGLRIASAHPARITALISQNGNAYTEGLTKFWDPLFAYYRDRAANEPKVRQSLEAESTRWGYSEGVPAERIGRISPDTWTVDQALLDRPGNKEIQLQLLWNYQTNIELYPTFQQYFRTHRPPTLAVWGKNDPIFGPAGAEAYRRDLPEAEIHLLDTGHFALETHAPEIASYIRDFLARQQ